jgi:hypothetical protein
MKKLVSLILALCLALSVCGIALGEQQPDRTVASSTYGWVVEPATQDEAHNVTATIVEAGTFEKKTFTTAYPMDRYNAVSDAYRADSIVTLFIPDTFVEVLFNAAGEVIDFEVIEKINAGMRGTGNYDYYFDSAKFGGELTAPGGGPGRMVAQGWVLEKDADARTITIGDGNHVVYSFEETYNLADDAKLYLVDNGYRVSGKSFAGTFEGTEITFDDIIVTEKEGEDGKCPGEIYYVPERYTALMIFDGDYTTYDSALVTEVYMYKNPLVLNESGINRDTDVARPDGMQYNGTSWMQAVSKVEEKHGFGWNGAVSPVTFLKDRLYSFGDSYTTNYMFIADNGDITLLDMGNEGATYQYWLNIEKLGYDPREVDHIIMTHGHGDHYQALYELVTMLNRYHVGLGDLERGENYPSVETAIQNETGYGYLGYPEIGPTLTDKSIRYCITKWTKWYQWYDLGGGVEIYPVGSTGHSPDSPAFAWIVTARDTDEYFEPGTKVGFVYNGAYGALGSVNAGYRRLAMNYGLQYVQQILAPYIDTLCDYIYYAPQHNNHYPINELDYIARKAGVPLMSIWTEGVANIQNVMEKRIATNFYEKFQSSWEDGTNEMSNYILEKIGIPAQTSSPTFKTQEKYGPFKRPAGEYEMEVLSVQLIQGCNAWQNVNDAYVAATQGMVNVYGEDLTRGLLSGIDAHVHNPDEYVVQVSCHVHDDYQGHVDYETNFYGAENYESAWTSGPVETANVDTDHVEDWFEILRTVYTDYDTALAIYNSVKAGETYKVNLAITSEILVAENAADTFVPVK